MKFLQKIKTNKRLIRLTKGRHNYFSHKSWKPADIPETEVYFLGYRTLFNGVVEHVQEEVPIFSYDETVPAALVVKNTKENPFYIRLEDIILITS